MVNILVLGIGEVGSAIVQLELEGGNDVFVIDKKYDTVPDQNMEYEILHVCIPFSETFIDTVVQYNSLYTPRAIIIHSTVAVGTTDEIRNKLEKPVLHSPIRGIHPQLYEGVITFTKYVGGTEEDLISVSDHLSKLNLSITPVIGSHNTELLKLLSTTYYAHNILFAKWAKDICDHYNADFETVYTHSNQTYNQGYELLEMFNVIRPVLYPPDERGLGGHCVSNNAKLLHAQTPTEITKNILSLGYDNKDTYKNEVWLYCERIGKEKTVEQIAQECEVTETTIQRQLDKYNIP
jgi:hypothetical protein